jgi:UDP-2,3-diacylglucosamine pyrophosphatase LpxH
LGVNPTSKHALLKLDVPETDLNRRLLTDVMRNARVKLVVHGHWHEFHDDTTIDGIRIVGLAANTSQDSSMALLKESCEIYPLDYGGNIREEYSVRDHARR